MRGCNHSSLLTHNSSLMLPKISTTIAVVLMLILTLDIGYCVDRHNFTHLILAYSSLFVLYFYILHTLRQVPSVGVPLKNLTQGVIDNPPFLIFNFKFLIGLAILLRGCLIFSVPNLSEDIYRFIWDGRLIHLSINPFNYKPSYFMGNQLFTDVLTPDLFQHLNSKEYFSVYPPVCQGVFAVAVWLFPKSIYGSMVVIKGFLFLCEIGTLFLMHRIGEFIRLTQQARRINSPIRLEPVLIYALNPLIIIELCGNAHFEAAMIFFFLLAVYILKNLIQHLPTRNYAYSAAAFALSVASKMLPIVFLPFFIKRLGFKKSVVYFTWIGCFTLLLFLPLYNEVFINNIRSSLNLYFQKFEFNASVYYVYSTIETAHWGFNPILFISKILMLTVLFSIFLLAIFEKKEQNTEGGIEKLFERCLFAISIYFLCAASVHPWYAALPLAISVFTRFRYIMVWTCLLPFTYIHYSYPKPTENYWVIGLEYLVVVSFFVFEILKPKNI